MTYSTVLVHTAIAEFYAVSCTVVGLKVSTVKWYSRCPHVDRISVEQGCNLSALVVRNTSIKVDQADALENVDIEGWPCPSIPNLDRFP